MESAYDSDPVDDFNRSLLFSLFPAWMGSRSVSAAEAWFSFEKSCQKEQHSDFTRDRMGMKSASSIIFLVLRLAPVPDLPYLIHDHITKTFAFLYIVFDLFLSLSSPDISLTLYLIRHGEFLIPHSSQLRCCMIEFSMYICLLSCRDTFVSQRCMQCRLVSPSPDMLPYTLSTLFADQKVRR